jgi:hypothetical protein
MHAYRYSSFGASVTIGNAGVTWFHFLSVCGRVGYRFLIFVLKLAVSSLDSVGMAASLYIVVEGEDPGFDIFVNGHALARNEEALERLAKSLEVCPLLEFFSADENSMALLLEQGAGDPDWVTNLPQPQWFDAGEGLKTVNALLEFVRSTPVSLGSETMPVERELLEYERVLLKTKEKGLRWHLAASWR